MTDDALRERQAHDFIEALQPRRLDRPLIAVLASNPGTETADFLLSYALIRRAGVAAVCALAPRPGRVELYPALAVSLEQDLATFDREHPDGADYVVVPAMQPEDEPAVTGWLQQQARLGARIIGICAGALVLGHAGLLDGRRFASHWYYRKKLCAHHPSAIYVPDQRYLIDRDVATTTGITASLPALLALVEAIGGRDRAIAIGGEIGIDSWTPAHDSSAFQLDRRLAIDFVLNKAAFWRRERWRVNVEDGMDDVTLALVTDAWSRTWRVRVEAAAAGTVKLRSGLELIAHDLPANLTKLPLTPELKPVQQLDRTLDEIEQRFGRTRRDWVMREMEYAGPGDCALGR